MGEEDGVSEMRRDLEAEMIEIIVSAIVGILLVLWVALCALFSGVR